MTKINMPRISFSGDYEEGFTDGHHMGRDIERSYWLQKLQEFLDLEERKDETD